MSGQFDGKVALVTGAASGIGRATAEAFAREEAKTVVSDVSAGAAQETVERIRLAGRLRPPRLRVQQRHRRLRLRRAGLVGFRNLPAYCVSKGGVIELTRATALE